MNYFVSSLDRGVERRPSVSLFGLIRRALALIPWLRRLFPMWANPSRCRQVDI
jgi:hypothetical protein